MIGDTSDKLGTAILVALLIFVIVGLKLADRKPKEPPDGS